MSRRFSNYFAIQEITSMVKTSVVLYLTTIWTGHSIYWWIAFSLKLTKTLLYVKSQQVSVPLTSLLSLALWEFLSGEPVCITYRQPAPDREKHSFTNINQLSNADWNRQRAYCFSITETDLLHKKSSESVYSKFWFVILAILLVHASRPVHRKLERACHSSQSDCKFVL